jgi:hypothetical protein
MVLQTAERGEADVLCTDDADFYDPIILSYCAARGIEICDELTVLERLSRLNQAAFFITRLWVLTAVAPNPPSAESSHSPAPR